MGTGMKPDQDLEQYRNVMTPPGTFEEGFSWASVIGAVFIGVLMVPGSMYMSLLAGVGVGPAAKWVTVLLFMEVAKRAHQSLRKAQIFTLFYMAGAVLATPFEGLLYSQFFVQSQAAIGQGMTELIPRWFAPSDPAVLATRNFFQLAWLPAIGLVIFKTIISRIDNSVLSFGLFKLASDVEKLPFPMAPIGAQGIMALSEDIDQKDGTPNTWRWRVFAIGGAIGLGFGFLYLGIPTLSSAILGTTIQMFPIPFADWTGRTQDFLPAVATGLSFDLGALMVGMVLPYWAVVGTFAGLIVTCALNPLLYATGTLRAWTPGDGTVETLFKNTVDFYFSFGLGLSLAIAGIGLASVTGGLRKLRQFRRDPNAVVVPKGRGDIALPVVGVVYVVSTLLYIVVCGALIGWHKGVMVVLIVYGFVYTPIISYVTARLEGMVGQALSIPLVREAGMILSGYRGVACWFLPFPIHNYGVHTVFYREAELTGTKFTSIWKTEAVLVPFIVLTSILFAQFIWSMGPIPSTNYPYANTIWELQARNQTLMYSSTMGGYSQFQEAFKPTFIGVGLVVGLGVFAALKAMSAPVLLLYGAVMGLNQTMPHVVIPHLIGALLGRYYFQKRFGDKWRQYVPVLTAGYFCGAGLITIFCVGVMFLSKSVFTMPY
ncbi:MAG: hypothetical protein PCFJNLEI_00579 [Verrucomicrobiae bacterium]|nr:hypothetical protein [Verrucomicrobiae bacterium]